MQTHPPSHIGIHDYGNQIWTTNRCIIYTCFCFVEAAEGVRSKDSQPHYQQVRRNLVPLHHHLIWVGGTCFAREKWKWMRSQLDQNGHRCWRSQKSFTAMRNILNAHVVKWWHRLMVRIHAIAKPSAVIKSNVKCNRSDEDKLASTVNMHDT